MRKFSLLLLLALIGSTLSEPLELQCNFIVGFYGYYCTLSQITVLDPSQEIIFTGQHIGNRTNADVSIIEIYNSNTPFVIPQLFVTFPNVKVFEVVNSNLQTIRIPDIVQLQEIILYDNNITRIDNESFTGQRDLLFLYLVFNQIEEIEEGAFLGHARLSNINLAVNRITEIPANLFRPLMSLEFIDLERNMITRLPGGLFANNSRLIDAYFESNEISEISPRFAEGMENAFAVFLNRNVCIDRAIEINGSVGLMILNNLLNPCFARYSGVDSEFRRITLEFTGSLSLFDEFGNIVARIN